MKQLWKQKNKFKLQITEIKQEKKKFIIKHFDLLLKNAYSGLNFCSSIQTFALNYIHSFLWTHPNVDKKWMTMNFPASSTLREFYKQYCKFQEGFILVFKQKRKILSKYLPIFLQSMNFQDAFHFSSFYWQREGGGKNNGEQLLLAVWLIFS